LIQQVRRVKHYAIRGYLDGSPIFDLQRAAGAEHEGESK